MIRGPGQEMDREGMEASWSTTSFGLGLFALTDHGTAAPAWSLTTGSPSIAPAPPIDCSGTTMIATDDIDRSVARVRAMSLGMGLRGAMISIGQASGEDYGDEQVPAFWSAIESSKDSHQTSTSRQPNRLEEHGSKRRLVCVFTPTMYTIPAMIFPGLFNRHPKLKVLSVDKTPPRRSLSSASAWTTARSTDHLGTGNRAAAGITSGRKPSNIFHGHVACTFHGDRTRSWSGDHRPGQPDVGTDTRTSTALGPTRRGDLRAAFDGPP